MAGQWLARADQDQLDPGLGAQRVEIVEIGDAWEQGEGDFDTSTCAPTPALPRSRGKEDRRVGGGRVGATGLQRHRIFGREQCCVGEIRYDAETGEAGALADRRDAAIEQA